MMTTRQGYVFLASLLLLIHLPTTMSETSYSIDQVIEIGPETSFASPIAFSNDGSIFAIGDSAGVTIWDSSSRTIITSVVVHDEPTDSILSLAFTDNDSYLLVGQRSFIASTPAISIINTSSWSRESALEIGESIDKILIQPNKNSFYSLDDSGILNRWNFTSNTPTKEWTMEPQIGESIICFDITTDGKTLIVGSNEDDGDGYVRTINISSSVVENQFLSTDGMSKCMFGASDSKMIWATDDLLTIRSYPDGEYLGYIDAKGTINQIVVNDVNGYVHLFTEREGGSIETHDFENLTLVSSRDLGHPVSNVALNLDGTELAITNGFDLLVFLSLNHIIPNYQPTGHDYDKDGIPDEVDYDDDGDGILDEFDNVCTGASDCSKSPDPNTIRTVHIQIETGKVVITDTVTLNISNSQLIRRLAANTDSSPGDHVDVFEVVRMQNAMCGDEEDSIITNMWRDMIRINGSYIEDIDVSCRVSTGLTGTTITHNDQDNIKLVWTLTGNITAEVIPPYDVHLLSYPGVIDGSIVESLPHKPIHLKLTMSDGSSNESSVWHEDSVPLIMTIDLAAPPTPSFFDKLISPILNYWWISLSIFSLLLLTSVLMLRGRHKIDFNSFECHLCGELNPFGATSCNECGGLFVYDEVMSKLHSWMEHNEMTAEELFIHWDLNENGFLESDELLQGLVSLKIAALPAEQIEALVEHLDVDGNGVIDLEEWELAIGAVEEPWQEEGTENEWSENEEWQDENWNEDESPQKIAPRAPPDQRKAPRGPPDTRNEIPTENLRKTKKSLKSPPIKRVQPVTKTVNQEDGFNPTEITSNSDIQTTQKSPTEHDDIDIALTKMFSSEQEPKETGSKRKPIRRRKK